MPPEPPRPMSPEDIQEDAVVAPPSPEMDGYQLLGDGQAGDGGLPVPHGLSSEDDASDDDDDDQPQSVAELMAALERHGVNTVETGDGTADQTDTGDTADTADTAGSAAGDTPAAAAPRAKEGDISLWPEGALEAERQRQKRSTQERLALYSATTSGGGGGPAAALAPDQAEAVRRAMRSVHLPGAERWASGLSDQQWQSQLDRLLGRPGVGGTATGPSRAGGQQKDHQERTPDGPQS